MACTPLDWMMWDDVDDMSPGRQFDRPDLYRRYWGDDGEGDEDEYPEGESISDPGEPSFEPFDEDEDSLSDDEDGGDDGLSDIEGAEDDIDGVPLDYGFKSKWGYTREDSEYWEECAMWSEGLDD